MHVNMPSMRCMSGHGGSRYVRTWHGDGTRLVLWHLWPMVGAAWLIFMLGAMMGTKSAMMRQQMMGAGGMGGMAHHHHGEGGAPCMNPACAEASEKVAGGTGI